ncbi:MAG: hypothetical protein Q8Q10_02750 [bacterium]|nr:hypothetical protein [bacterium]
MDTDLWTGEQAARILTLLGKQQLTIAQSEKLILYLPILGKAIKEDVAPPYDQFHERVGLGPLFPKDQYGRILITVTGSGLLNEEWGPRLKSGGFVLEQRDLDVLNQPDYNENHRLVPGKQYTVALVLGKEVSKDAERTTAHIRQLGERDYGKSSDLRGELALLIREAISDEQMKRWGIHYIAVPHELIRDSVGQHGIFAARRMGDGREVHVYFDYPGACWRDRGAFAYPVSQ